MLHSAITRQLEIIGEATKRLSPSLRAAHPHIPWRRMAGLRDLLIHAYDHIDLEAVYNISTNDVPQLIPLVTPILVSLATEQG